MMDKPRQWRRIVRITLMLCSFFACALSAWVVAEEALSPDFLEFLAEGEKINGEWIDPFDAEQDPPQSPPGDDVQSEDARDE